MTDDMFSLFNRGVLVAFPLPPSRPDPCRAAIPAHPTCAGSLVLPGRWHRVMPDPLAVSDPDEHIWLFCSPSCLAAWSAALCEVAS